MSVTRSLNSLSIFGLAIWLLSGLPVQAEPPAAAAKAGYLQNTFSSSLTKDNVSLTQAPTAGKDWFLWNFFTTKTPADAISFGPDGTASIIGEPGRHNNQIASAAVVDAQKGQMIGRAFGGGGYFEAEIAFDPEAVRKAGPTGGWPSFWSLAYEVLTRDMQSQWPGQVPGYEQYIEVDFMEYNMTFRRADPNHYGTDVHHFYGIFRKTCKNWFCNYNKTYIQALATVPPATDFTKFHRYGFLWVPATDASPGYGQHYFDDMPVGTRIEWTKMSEAAAPPPMGKSWAYGLIDRQHLVIALGSGSSSPMFVRKVNVWQKSDDKNIRN